MSFSGKVVIVTGASSGIGAASAVRFAEKGASLVLVGLEGAQWEATEEACSTHGVRPVIVTADVTSDQDAKRIIEETIKRFGKLDILVNNVGIYVKDDKIDLENYMEAFDRTMGTNLRAAVHLTHLALPHLVKTKGNIVNIASVSGIKPYPMMAYCTSKAGIVHFTRCVALEFAPMGVRANSVSPGPVSTNILENAGVEAVDAFWARAKNDTALDRISQPDEVAAVVLFLASDEARGVTGSNYVTDNGMLLK